MSRHRERPSKRINPSGKVVWVARYTDHDGRRVYAKPTATYELKGPCRKPREDGECCAQHRIDVGYERSKLSPARSGTVAEYARQWLRDRPRSARTNETNAHRLEVVLGPFTDAQLERERSGKYRARRAREGVKVDGVPLSDWRMEDLRPRHGNELLTVLLVDQGRSAAGAKNILLTLSAMFNDAIRDEMAIVNPWGVKVKASDPRVSKEPRKPRVLEWEQMHALAQAAGEHEPMVRVCADCGLRLGELLGLAVEDVKLGRCDELGCPDSGPHLHVRRTAHDGVVSDGTKRERLRGRLEGGRVVPLPPATVVSLRTLPPRIPARAADGSPLPFFASPSGGWWREDTWRDDVWDRARKASGVLASPQDFRHSWVSLLRAAGLDPLDLARIAGHSVEVATATYAHALGRSNDAVRAAVGA